MKKALYIFLIIIALALTYLKFNYGGEVSPAPSPIPSPVVVASPIPMVRSFTTDYFTLEYPVEASAAAESEGIDFHSWRIYFMGDKQRASGRTQTELFDGYAVSLTRFEGVGEELERTQAEADQQGIIDACGKENVTDIVSKKYLARQILTFFGGCLGEADYYYFVERDHLYRITSMVVGEDLDKEKYQVTVERILTSLKFTD